MSLEPEAAAKFDAELRKALARAIGEGEALPVIVTLTPADLPPTGSPRPPAEERIRWARQREAEFERETAELGRALEQEGAQELRRHWMARSLSGRFPHEAIAAAARRPEVVRVALVVPRDILL